MNEILDLLDEIEEKLQPGPRQLKVKLARLMIIASEDVSKLIKSQDFEGVEQRLRKLAADQNDVRAKYVVSQFPSGGIQSK